MRTVEHTVYTFEELSESAKEKARDWWREAYTFSDDGDYEQFETAAKHLGIEFDTQPVKLMSGKTRYDSNIMWSGFSSQGDGASFTGDFTFKPNCLHDIREEFPQHEALHSIADKLTTLYCRLRLADGTKLSGKIRQHNSHYVHACTMDGTAYNEEGEELDMEVSKEFEELMRDFANWIYKSLKEEYEYQTSDESIDEAIIGNEYEFDEEGERA